MTKEEALNKYVPMYGSISFKTHIEQKVYLAMDEYAKQVSIGFLEYEKRFRKEESIWFKKECERLGGMFSMADYGVENIYNDFINRKPIKCHWELDGKESQWEYDNDGKLVHVIKNTPNT